MDKSLRPLLYWITILWVAAKRLYNEKYSYQASALAFETLLSMVPVLSVIVYGMTVFPLFTRLITFTRDYIYANFIPASGDIIQKYLNEFTTQATQLPLLGIFFSLLAGLMLMFTIESAFDDIWHPKSKRRRTRTVLLLLAIFIFLPLFIGISVFLSTFLLSFSWVGMWGLTIVLFDFLHLIINTMIFAIIYMIAPNRRIKWSDAMLGGFIAAMLFEFAKKAFALYVIHFPSYKLIYGALSIIPIFLIWLYISWVIILFGALVIHAKQQQEE
ncbi:YihY family inner membrane protein [Aquicella lusitana]|uniref:tRNA-processing RNAse BN n=1 Tax=Aquicella lusitana TaxID=254246 RepID=A0A370GPX4_9COXI|nr:YihY family inner membrane protein [Aquicella lusitana]RDI44534.1 tRNA-processing RNAse BN [Aquicella lusitana]VVC72524.1 hypothetical protein AQULUS_02360 [Aquicella lusitana]